MGDKNRGQGAPSMDPLPCCGGLFLFAGALADGFQLTIFS
jgi:hypothetical protein